MNCAMSYKFNSLDILNFPNYDYVIRVRRQHDCRLGLIKKWPKVRTIKTKYISIMTLVCSTHILILLLVSEVCS